MKRVICCCVAILFLAFSICGCNQKKELSKQPVSEEVISAFLQTEEEAVSALGLSDPEIPEGGKKYRIYHKSLSWCGEMMETEFVFRDGRPIRFQGQKAFADGDDTRALAESYTATFKAAFGLPKSCTFFQNGVSKTYGTYVEDGNESSVEAEGFESIFSGTETGQPLLFRFLLPGMEEKDMIYAECSFYRTGDAENPIVFEFQVADYSI